MARTVQSPRLNTRTARSRLAQRAAPYWVQLSAGLHLGYSNKGAGVWLVKLRDPATGQRYQQKLGPADDVLDAGAGVLTFEQAQARARAWTIAEAPTARGRTVGDALDAYLKILATRATPSTVKDTDLRIEARIRPVLGEVLLDRLTTDRIRTWHADLIPADAVGEAQRRARDTANRILTILKAALNHAYGDGWIATDAAWRRAKPFPSVGAARKVFLTEEQCANLLEAAPEDARALFQAALFTGCRFGELANARVGDWDGEVLRVSGKTGTRDVFLSKRAQAWFTAHTRRRPADALLLVRADGTAWHKMAAGRAMKAAVALADLPADTCFYSLRHTYISLALKRGVQHQVLAENCGTSIRMLEVHYGKFMRADRQQMFEVM